MASNGVLSESIAIVGIGCRFPGGATTADEFWNFLRNRGNGVSEVPADRWGLEGFYDPDPAAIARSTTKWGGFLQDIRRFDPEFFGISTREAGSMDPQQRILMQVVYEALQDARLRISDVQAARTGVFVGVSTSDYGAIQRLRRTTNDIYAGTGAALSIVSNRISHRLNLSGPSYSVDTACSSSLVALDQACWNLDEGTCSIAIAGGVNILADPGAFIAFSKAGMLSTTGTISTFDAAANGYVRGEGCGAVILKRLSDARRDGDRIYALIRATSVNQDGHTPTLTAPNPDRQYAMMRTLCERAGVDPANVDYVEAHGTGTPVGDPIEATALGRVFGVVRKDEPVLIGSVKPNIGHLESAAGISGLIKTAMAVHHRSVPPNRNFRQPNPHIPFDALGIAVPTEQTPIGNGIARAAVNSFGFGGTNASALLESFDPSEGRPVRKAAASRQAAPRPTVIPVAISAATRPSLQTFCGRLVAEMAPGGTLAEASPGEIAANLAAFRDDLRHRAVALATSREHLAALLTEIAEDRVPEPEPRKLPHTVIGTAERSRHVTFTFAGQGGQWWAMGRQLLAGHPVFRDKVEAFDRVFRTFAGWSVVSELKRPEARSRVHDPAVTQPAIFAVQIGLAAIWQAAGVVPELIVGHSFGEVAAAHVAGALDLDNAAKLIHRRGLIAEHVATDGGMLAIGLDPDRAREYLADFGSVDIAAFNGPAMITASGRADEIAALHQRLSAERPDLLVRRLAMNIAWHSKWLEPAKEWFLEAMGDLEWQAPAIPFVSTVTGLPETCLDVEYWWGNLRQPVAYEKAIGVALRLGADLFLEIGPHRTLSGLTATIAASHGRQLPTPNSLVQNVDDFHALSAAAATLYTHGVRIDWRAFSGPTDVRLGLPRYAWDEIECWSDSEESRWLLNRTARNPLLGYRSIGPDVAWESEFNLMASSYLNDHAVNGDVIFPAAGYMDIMLAAGLDYFESGPVEIDRLSISDALFIARDDDILLRTTFDPDTGRIRIFSHLRDSTQDWIERASAHLMHPNVVRPAAPHKIKGRTIARLQGPGFYALAARHGFQYGPEFQGATDILLKASGVDATVEAPSGVASQADRHAAHPAILDAAMQTMIPLIDLAEGRPLHASGEAEDPYPLFLPIGVDRARLFSPLPARVKVLAYPRTNAGGSAADYVIVDSDGKVCMTIEGFRSQRMTGKGTEEKKGATSARFFVETFISLPPPGEPEAARSPAEATWLVLPDAGGITAAITAKLAAGGASIEVAHPVGHAAIDPDFLRCLIADRLPADRRTAILIGLALDTPDFGPDAAPTSVQDAVERNVLSLLALGKALDGLRDRALHPEVWVLTRGARALPGDPAMTVSGLAQAPLTGMLRTIAGECREFPVRHVDFGSASPQEVANCVEMILAGTNETELVMRDRQVLVPRLEAGDDDSLPRQRIVVLPQTSGSNFVATMHTPGSLDAISIEEAPLDEPGPDEVRVAVEAVGLNFRDIMAATGLLPPEAERDPAWRNLGLEYAGTVVATGANVIAPVPGDRVMGMGRRCLQAFINQPAAAVVKLPDGISSVDASTIPSAFSTAHYALNHVGRLAPGETVLIHVATGGVGLAAIQLAKRAGATIFATAGSDHKRDYLEKLGVHHVMNSRSHDFADQIMALTDGRGVDIVLNSLPGDFITKGISILAPFGRFLEIGKRDVYEDSPIGMKALRKNISLNVIDLAAMGHERPDLLQRLVEETMEMFTTGELSPLPATVFPIREVNEAFRYMSQARHIGKVVVSIPPDAVAVSRSADKPVALRQDRSYLVTGGSRGFGIAVAEWLAASGAGRVILASRSGKPDADAVPAIAALAVRGVEIVNLALDITDPEAVAAAVAAAAAADKPLAGIVHGAAVIKDGFLSQLDPDTVLAVLRPKTLGAWNLHRALAAAGVEVDFFISFSSLAQVLGSIGQANYVAANAFLDAFASYRRGNGAPGQTIDWGALGEAGFVARSDSMTNYLESMGMQAVSNRDATGALSRLLTLDVSSIAFASVDWGAIARATGKGGLSPRLHSVLTAETAGGGRIRSEIAAAPRDLWPAVISAFLAEQVSKVLRKDAAEIDGAKALTELGFDSLSSIELKNRVEGQLGLSIPVSTFLQSPTLGGLADVIAELLDEEIRQRAAASSESGLQTAGGVAIRKSSNLPTTHEQQAILEATTGPLLSPAGRGFLERRVQVHLRSMPDATAVAQAFAKVVRRHALLRATTTGPSGQHGEIHAGEAPRLQVGDEALAKFDRPLSVPDGELVRAAYAVSKAGGDLRLAVHAALTDRVGFATVVEELLKLLDGQELDRAPGNKALLAALTQRCFDEASPEAQADKAHWMAVMQPPVPAVRFERRRRALTSFNLGPNRGPTATRSFEIAWPWPWDDAESALLAAFATAISATTGQPDIVIERASAVRPAEIANAIVGPFEERFPVVVRAIGKGGMPEPAAQVRRQLRSGQKHAALGTAYVESLLSGAEAAGLRQFGFCYGHGTGDDALLARLRGLKVGGKPVRVVTSFAGPLGVNELVLFVNRRSPTVVAAEILFDSDVVPEGMVGEIVRRLAGDNDEPRRDALKRTGHARNGARRSAGASGSRAKPSGASATGSPGLNGKPSDAAVRSHSPASAIPAGRANGTARAEGGRQVFPATPNQRWILDALGAQDCTRTFRRGMMMAQGLIVRPAIEARRLRNAVTMLTRANETLRTRFERAGGAWRAIIDPEHPTGLIVEDIGNITDAELKRLVDRLAGEDYDLEAGPLFQIRLMHAGARGDIILMRVHHAVVDGWSLIRLFEGLFAAYMGAVIEFNPALSTAALFREMEAQKRSKTAERNRRHWASILEPWLPTPRFGRLARGIPLNLSGGWCPPKETIVARIEGDDFHRFEDAARRVGVTTNSLLMTAFARSLARVGDVEALYLASLYPMRTHPVLKDFVGNLVADVPIRAEVPDGVSFEKLAVDLHRQATESYGCVDFNLSINDLFKSAPQSSGAFPRATCSGLAPEHLARMSPFEPLLAGTPGQSFRFGGMEVWTLPIPPLIVDDSEISLRPMVTSSQVTLRLSYEVLAFTRTEAEIILDDMLAQTGVSAAGLERDVESVGAAEDWAAAAGGHMPGPSAGVAGA